MTLRLITAPASEPVTLTEAKLYLRVDHTTDDALITQLIKAAREKGEELSRRAFITQTWEYTGDGFPETSILKLLRPPLLTVVSVKYKDNANTESTMDSADYIVNTNIEPGVVIFRNLPSVSLLEAGAVTVRFTAGYGASSTNVPERIRYLILSLIAYWYENRERTDVPKEIERGFIAERAVWFQQWQI